MSVTDLERLAAAINVLGDFCGPRDLEAMTRAEFRRVTGLPRAEVLLFFGGSPVAGLAVLEEALTEGVADRSVLVGGEGHTTPSLREQASTLLDGWDFSGMSEAEIYAHLLDEVHMLSADLLERESTNCGENITRTLELLDRNGIQHHSYLLVQDATMQRRMHATLERHRPGMKIFNYAAYRASVVVGDGSLAYESEISGMWPIQRYVSMLLGEVRRLRDDTDGYGPNGKGWLVHVDIPQEVEAAFSLLTDSGFGPRPAGDSWWAGE